MKRIFLVSGERSGDLHAAELLSALDSNEEGYDFHGIGGPELVTRFGSNFEDWIEEAAVIGFSEVIKKYSWFKQKFTETLDRITELNPSAVVLVDYPGFNLRLAKALRKQGYEGKICYYISPQVWAWNRGRIPKMAKILDLMLCVFEFEKELYQKSGLHTEWVGHPMVEELEERRIEVNRDANLVGLFPGSRGREVRSLLPLMLEAAQRVLVDCPDTKFELAVASDHIMTVAEDIIKSSPIADQVTCKIGESYRLMQEAGAAWIASGTASLEAGFYGLPYALVYKVSPLTYSIAKLLVKIPYIGMVNILADKLVIQEFIQAEANPENLIKEMCKILTNTPYRDTMKTELATVKLMLGGGGAHQKAARAIAQKIQS